MIVAIVIFNRHLRLFGIRLFGMLHINSESWNVISLKEAILISTGFSYDTFSCLSITVPSLLFYDPLALFQIQPERISDTPI